MIEQSLNKDFRVGFEAEMILFSGDERFGTEPYENVPLKILKILAKELSEYIDAKVVAYNTSKQIVKKWAIVPEELDTNYEDEIGPLEIISPPLILIIVVLGSILTGIATPTESAAVGAVGATIIAFFLGQLNLKIIQMI